MKNRFALSLLSLAVLAAVLPASAQRAQPYQIGGYNGGTNNVAAASTNTVSATIACSEFDNIGFQLSAVTTAATNCTLLTRWAKTLDSTTYETVPSVIVPITFLSGTNVTAISTVSIPSAAGLKLVSIENTNAGCAMTNLNFKVRFKAPKEDGI